MNVRELIEQLKNFPEESRVVVYDSTGGYFDLDDVTDIPIKKNNHRLDPRDGLYVMDRSRPDEQAVLIIGD